MRTVFIICFLFVFSVAVFAQNNYTIVYDKGTELVIQDSVAFCYYPSSPSNSNRETPLPLGSGYWPKSTYFHAKRGIQIHIQGWQNKPKTHRLLVRKCDRGKWKITNEQKNILGYTCIKATGKRDDQYYTVWYCPELPAGFGIFMLTTLPGTILESTNEDRHYTNVAKEVRKDALPIVEPNFCKRIKQTNR